jgi:hypothetical protein
MGSVASRVSGKLLEEDEVIDNSGASGTEAWEIEPVPLKVGKTDKFETLLAAIF